MEERGNRYTSFLRMPRAAVRSHEGLDISIYSKAFVKRFGGKILKPWKTVSFSQLCINF